MRNYSYQSKHPLGFFQLMMVPVFTFFLGFALIELTCTPYQLTSDSIVTDLIFGCGFAIISFALAIAFSRTSFAGSLRQALQDMLSVFRQLTVPQIVILSISAGISEELLFRGFLQEWFMGYASAELSIVTAAVIFGLLHSITISYFLLATTLGLALGITYEISQSLLLVMIWHGVYDILAIYALARKPQVLGINYTQD